MDTIVCVVLGLLVLYYFLRNGPRKNKSISGPKGWPIVGYAPYLKKGKEHEIFSNLADTYGEIFRITILGQSLIVLNNANCIRTAFSSDKYKMYMNDRSAVFFGKYVTYRNQGIAFMSRVYGSKHAGLRKVFAKGMHVYGEGKREFEDRIMSELMNLMKRINNHQGTEFNMLVVLRRSLTNIMSVLLCGHDLMDDDKDVDMFWEFDKWADYLAAPDINLVLTSFPFLRFVPGKYKTAFENIERAKDTIIKRCFYDKKATYEPGNIKGLVDYLIAEQLEEQKNGPVTFLTDENIKAMILETIAAGILTTLGSLSSLFLCLLNHPEYQEKIQAELDRIVGRGRLPRIEDRQKCVFTEAVIVEAQRYIPTLPLSIPHFCEKRIEFEGFEIPPKSLIVPNVWRAHHDEKVWGDPWNFRPERWLDENGCPLPNDHVLRKSWLAFGVGRRQCAGESLARSRIFLYVATLLQRWTFEMPPEHAVSCDPRRGHFNFDINCRPKPYMCRVVPRRCDVALTHSA